MTHALVPIDTVSNVLVLIFLHGSEPLRPQQHTNAYLKYQLFAQRQFLREGDVHHILEAIRYVNAEILPERYQIKAVDKKAVHRINERVCFRHAVRYTDNGVPCFRSQPFSRKHKLKHMNIYYQSEEPYTEYHCSPQIISILEQSSIESYFERIQVHQLVRFLKSLHQQRGPSIEEYCDRWAKRLLHRDTTTEENHE